MRWDREFRLGMRNAEGAALGWDAALAATLRREVDRKADRAAAAAVAISVRMWGFYGFCLIYVPSNFQGFKTKICIQQIAMYLFFLL